MTQTNPALTVSLLAVALGGVACDSRDSAALSREPLARAAPINVAAGSAKPARDPKAPKVEVQHPRSGTTEEAKEEAQTGKVNEVPTAPLPEATGRSTHSSPAVDEAAPKRAAPSSGLKVRRFVITSGIEGREPAAASELRVGGSPIVAFLELANPGAEVATVELTFERGDGTRVGHVELEVPAKSSRWRTWGRTRQIRQAGQWVAVVRDEAGGELARQGFDVAP